jgi:hypothetical protein
MDKTLSNLPQSVDFTNLNSEKILKFEKEIAYFYGAKDPELIAQHYMQAIKALETKGAAANIKILREKMLPSLENAYQEVKKQTSLHFDVELAAALEFGLILAQSKRASSKDINGIMLALYKEMFQSDAIGIQKAALLRTFLYQYKIKLLSFDELLSDADIELLRALARRSEEELNSIQSSVKKGLSR